MWSANLLNDEVSTDEGTLSPIFLGAAGATRGSLQVDAKNPPVLLPGTDGAMHWVASPEQVDVLVGGAMPLELVVDVLDELVIELPTVEGYGVVDGSVSHDGSGIAVRLDIGH